MSKLQALEILILYLKIYDFFFLIDSIPNYPEIK